MLIAAALCLAAVHDGDSIRLCDGTRVRLVSASGPIDAPEVAGSPPCRDARAATRQCDFAAGERARIHLTQLLTSPATIECVGQDRYGRALCRIRVNGRDIGDMMVDGGFAIRRDDWNRERSHGS